MFPYAGPVDRFLARKIDRTVALSYNSMLFLQQHGFRLEHAFGKGVPYLSRAEHQFFRENFLAGQQQHPRDPIDVAAQDLQTQKFYAWASHKILSLGHRTPVP